MQTKPNMATTSFYVLFEAASGWGLFTVLESEEIGTQLQEVSAVGRRLATNLQLTALN